ncbi:MAG: GNAT family N-acetyltransferase [Desulfobacter sp.]|nr:MAG: GNAT family N-acetyltransferase [Desulfobacter sp.]
MTPHHPSPYAFFNRPAAGALYQALTPDPFYYTLERCSSKDPGAAREAMFRYMDYSMAEAREHGKLTLTEDGASGAAIWALPLPPASEKAIAARKKDFILTHLGPESLSAYTDIVAFMAEKTGDVVPEDAWYLSILGIVPGHQGQGLGTKLMAPVLQEADTQCLAVYAESFTPENFGFYRGLGFHTEKTVSEPVTGSSYTVLVRPPRA